MKKSKRNENKVKKRGKKQKNRLELRFALFHFEAKITEAKRKILSEKKRKNAKKCEKIDLNFSSEAKRKI